MSEQLDQANEFALDRYGKSYDQLTHGEQTQILESMDVYRSERAYQKGQAWVVIVRPSWVKELQIAEDMKADGFDPKGSGWYDVMENVTFAAYIRASSETQARRIGMGEYKMTAIYREPWEYKVIVRPAGLREVHQDKIYVLRGRDLRDLVIKMY